MLGSWATAFMDFLRSAYERSPPLADAALIFFLLSLFLNRDNLVEVFKKCLPRSLKVNVLAYSFDALFVVVPLTYLIVRMQDLLFAHGLILIGFERFAAIPDLVTVFLVVFVGDFIGYFRHRLEHSKLLWPSHVLHHSDDDMTWFTLFRFHPINRLTTAVIDTGTLVLLGFPEWAIFINGLVRHYYGMFIHANVPWTYGRLGRVFVSPAMHRWHHVREGRGIYSNYATVFSVFDQLFNTYYVPGPCDQPLGVADVEHGSFFSQLLLPFSELLAPLTKKRAERLESARGKV